MVHLPPPACHIEPPLADIDPNHSLAVHADLHHVSRVRTAHAIVSGRRAPSTVRVPDRRDAGGPPDQHGRKDLPGPRGPAGGCFLRQTAPTYNPGPPQTVTVPGLQRITSLRFVLRCARDTRNTNVEINHDSASSNMAPPWPPPMH